MQKIKNIEFIRVIACLAIILLHIFNPEGLLADFSNDPFVKMLRNMTCNGQKAVDLFFILSGLFFAIKLNTNYSYFDFIKSKITRLYPVFIFVIVISFFTHLTGCFQWNLYDNLLAFLCLNGTSLVIKHGSTQVGQFWYVSAMLWTLSLYYYLLKNYDKKNVNLLIAMTVFFCYSFLIHAKGGKINNHEQTFYYIFNVGMMRAMAGIGVGYFVGEWYKNNIENIRKLTTNLSQKCLITIGEFCCLYFIINNLMLHKIKYKNDIVFILAFALIIILFLIKQGYISKLLEDSIIADISVKIAKYTYSLYMTHIFILAILKGSIWKYHPELVYSYPILNFSITLTLIMFAGIITYHFVEKPCADYFKNKAKTLVAVERESNPSI